MPRSKKQLSIVSLMESRLLDHSSGVLSARMAEAFEHIRIATMSVLERTYSKKRLQEELFKASVKIINIRRSLEGIENKTSQVLTLDSLLKEVLQHLRRSTEIILVDGKREKIEEELLSASAKLTQARHPTS